MDEDAHTAESGGEGSAGPESARGSRRADEGESQQVFDLNIMQKLIESIIEKKIEMSKIEDLEKRATEEAELQAGAEAVHEAKGEIKTQITALEEALYSGRWPGGGPVSDLLRVGEAEDEGGATENRMWFNAKSIPKESIKEVVSRLQQIHRSFKPEDEGGKEQISIFYDILLRMGNSFDWLMEGGLATNALFAEATVYKAEESARPALSDAAVEVGKQLVTRNRVLGDPVLSLAESTERASKMREDARLSLAKAHEILQKYKTENGVDLKTAVSNYKAEEKAKRIKDNLENAISDYNLSSAAAKMDAAEKLVITIDASKRKIDDDQASERMKYEGLVESLEKTLPEGAGAGVVSKVVGDVVSRIFDDFEGQLSQEEKSKLRNVILAEVGALSGLNLGMGLGGLLHSVRAYHSEAIRKRITENNNDQRDKETRAFQNKFLDIMKYFTDEQARMDTASALSSERRAGSPSLSPSSTSGTRVGSPLSSEEEGHLLALDHGYGAEEATESLNPRLSSGGGGRKKKKRTKKARKVHKTRKVRKTRKARKTQQKYTKRHRTNRRRR